MSAINFALIAWTRRNSRTTYSQKDKATTLSETQPFLCLMLSLLIGWHPLAVFSITTTIVNITKTLSKSKLWSLLNVQKETKNHEVDNDGSDTQ